MCASRRGQTPKLQKPSQEVTTSPQMLLGELQGPVAC